MRAVNFSRRLACALALFIVWPAWAGPRFPDRFEYHPQHELQQPSGLAAQLALKVTQSLGNGAALDRTLIEAAERMARDPNLTARDAMRASGVSDAFALPIRYHVDDIPRLKPVAHVLEGDVRHARVTHFGVAVRREDTGFSIVLLFVRRGAWLGRFPTHFEIGQRYVLDGRLTRGLKTPKLLVAGPGSRVLELNPRSSHGVFWTHIAFDQGPGRYIIEVQAVDQFGTQVLNLMEVYASEPGTPREVPVVRLRPPVRPPATAEDAAARALELVNRSRRAHRLPPLRGSKLLSKEAAAHATDMATAGFFGHASPTRGNLSARLNGAGLRLPLALENIAIGLSPETVHAELLRSPSHLRNILDPDVTHLGVGAFRRTVNESRPVFTFSQIFARLR